MEKGSSSRERKALSQSIMYFHPGKAQVPQGKGHNAYKCPSFSKKYMFWIFLQLQLFRINLWPIVGKGFKECYNFVSGSTSIKTYVQKLSWNQISNTYACWENMVAPKVNPIPIHGWRCYMVEIFNRSFSFYCFLMKHGEYPSGIMGI